MVASALLGQRFSDPAGKPLPQYFQPRPLAAGAGYDGTASAAANLGPGDPRLIAVCLPVQAADGRSACDPNSVPQLAAAYRTFSGLAAGTLVAVDAVTSSGSGLDPGISVANADLQAPVARARRLPLTAVLRLVWAYTSGRVLDFLESCE